ADGGGFAAAEDHAVDDAGGARPHVAHLRRGSGDLHADELAPRHLAPALHEPDRPQAAAEGAAAPGGEGRGPGPREEERGEGLRGGARTWKTATTYGLRRTARGKSWARSCGAWASRRPSRRATRATRRCST